MYFRSNSFIKYTVDYIHHLVIHDVLYSIRHLMNGWILNQVQLILQVHGGLHTPFGNTWCALFHQTLDEWLGHEVKSSSLMHSNIRLSLLGVIWMSSLWMSSHPDGSNSFQWLILRSWKSWSSPSYWTNQNINRKYISWTWYGGSKKFKNSLVLCTVYKSQWKHPEDTNNTILRSLVRVKMLDTGNQRPKYATNGTLRKTMMCSLCVHMRYWMQHHS